MAQIDFENDPLQGQHAPQDGNPPPPAPAPLPMPTVPTPTGSGSNQADRIPESRRNDFLDQAKSLGVSDSYISDFLAKNPGDYNRLASSYDSGHAGEGPDTNAPSSGSGFNYKDPTTGAWTSMPALAQGTGGPLRVPALTPGNLSSVTGQPYNYSSQFSDPYTNQLEALIKSQLDALQNPAANSPQQQLTNFLQQQFQRLSQSQGYTPDQQAMLKTQALEPLVANRDSANRRVLERASQFGMLPSSGLVQDQQAENDRTLSTQQAAMGRDLGINQINMQAQQLQQALGLGTQLSQLDTNTRNQMLQLATLLYQLPINAENQAMSVINGTGQPISLLQQLTSMLTNQQNMSAQQQAALYNAIGGLIPGMLGG